MTRMISCARPDGQRLNVYRAEPEGDNGPDVVVPQEWWGLNDQICRALTRHDMHLCRQKRGRKQHEKGKDTHHHQAPVGSTNIRPRISMCRAWQNHWQ